MSNCNVVLEGSFIECCYFCRFFTKVNGSNSVKIFSCAVLSFNKKNYFLYVIPINSTQDLFNSSFRPRLYGEKLSRARGSPS